MPARTYRLSLTRAFPSGAWIVSALVDNHLETRTYYGYSRREALARFRAEFPGLA